MINSYFAIKQFTNALAPNLQNAKLALAFSYSINDLGLGFELVDQTFGLLKISFTEKLTLYSWSHPIAGMNRPKNAEFPFQMAIGCNVLALKQVEGERVLHILLTNKFEIIIKLTGGSGNVFLFEDNKLINHFKKNRKTDQNIEIGQLLTATLAPKVPIITPKTQNQLLKMVPALKQGFVKDWLHNSSYDTQSEEMQQKALTNLFRLLESSYWIANTETELPNWTPILSTHNAFSFAQLLQFESAFLRTNGTTTLKTKLQNILQKRIEKSQNRLEVLQNRLNELNGTNRLEEIGHLILAQPNAIIEDGLVTLNDFYIGGVLKVSVNPNWTPQKNAERYYQKAKNRHLELNELEKQVATIEKQIDVFKNALLQTDTAINARDLQPIKKLVQQNEKAENTHLPYRLFHLQNYVIWVGKNAQSNDQMLRLAHKNDYWLHARNYAGSHVIIRANNREVPQNIIEQAASIALYYSKGKTDGYAAVIVTQCKYVRKPKGTTAGKVIIEKERVVMVSPKIF